MKKIRIFALGLGILATAIVIVGSFLPREWDVLVSTTSQTAKPNLVFANINDFKNWNSWAIWKDADPEYKAEFSEPSFGVGAWQKWNSAKSGKGQLWITQSDSKMGIQYEGAIESGDKKNAQGRIQFSNLPSGGVEIIWADKGTLPPIIGGLLRPLIQKSLTEHFKKSIDRLAEISSVEPLK